MWLLICAGLSGSWRVCDANDAFHALNCFEGKWFDGSIGYQCNCAGPSPAAAAAASTKRPRPRTGVTLRGPSHAVRPGEVFEVHVYLDDGLDALRGYQLHLGFGGGGDGALELIDIAVQPGRREMQDDRTFLFGRHARALEVSTITAARVEVAGDDLRRKSRLERPGPAALPVD